MGSRMEGHGQAAGERGEGDVEATTCAFPGLCAVLSRFLHASPHYAMLFTLVVFCVQLM